MHIAQGSEIVHIIRYQIHIIKDIWHVLMSRVQVAGCRGLILPIGESWAATYHHAACALLVDDCTLNFTHLHFTHAHVIHIGFISYNFRLYTSAHNTAHIMIVFMITLHIN